MSGHRCPRCAEPITDDGAICWACTHWLEGQLHDIPGQLAELDTTTWRQAVMPASATTAPDCDHDTDDCSCGVSLPWNDHARKIADGLRSAITTWARIMLDHYAPPCEHTSCRNGTRPACITSHLHVALAGLILDGPPAAWLADNTTSIRMRPWAAEMANDIGKRTALGWQAVDRHEDRFYAGPCGNEVDGTPCPRRLWARPEQSAVKCITCGTLWQVADRQAWLLAAASDLQLPASEIASALTLMTRKRVSAANVRQLASRGRITRVNPDTEPRPRYRVGDVLTLLRLGEIEGTMTG